MAGFRRGKNCTTMRFLVDANVLIYTRDFRDPAKQAAAQGWMLDLAAREAAIVNLQILNEICHVGLRKLRHLSAGEVQAWIEDLMVFGDAPIDAGTVAGAWPIHLRYRLSWFDCLVLASAEALGCTHVLTEDMGAPRTIGDLMLVNPFVAHPRDFLSMS